MLLLLLLLQGCLLGLLRSLLRSVLLLGQGRALHCCLCLVVISKCCCLLLLLQVLLPACLHPAAMHDLLRSWLRPVLLLGHRRALHCCLCLGVLNRCPCILLLLLLLLLPSLAPLGWLLSSLPGLLTGPPLHHVVLICSHHPREGPKQDVLQPGDDRGDAVRLGGAPQVRQGELGWVQGDSVGVLELQGSARWLDSRASQA